MPSGGSMPPSEPSARVILLLSDCWSSTKDGIAGVTKSLALSLTSYTGIKLYLTVFTPSAALSPSDKAEAEQNNVTLISLADKGAASMQELYTKFNENPTEFAGTLKEQIPYVHQIVGHAPVTAEAAVKLRDAAYPDAKVVLFFHMIPHEAEWIHEKVPYVVPTDTELVHLGEQADVVYSVTEKLHWHNTAKFRNRATLPVDHRLFLPQCSQAVFSVNRKVAPGVEQMILVTAEGGGAEDWLGLDIAVCAVNKLAREWPRYGSMSRPLPSLVVGGIAEDKVVETKEKLSSLIDQEDLKLEVHSYKTQADFFKDLSECSLCLVPSRSEPFGYMGLHALSAGIPTLIAEDSALATVVKRLTLEPDLILVPVTPTMGSVRQDASTWRDRILSVLQDTATAHERAMQLRTALRRDEVTKDSQDNFISYCLGGIRLKHEVTEVDFLFQKEAEKELPVRRSFNAFLTAALKQCWRLKHHPLTKAHDLIQILPGVDLPIEDLRNHVTDKIEEYDRRIVGVDKDTGAFIIYCPSAEALSDLWAMCDRINAALSSRLLRGEENKVLEAFRLRKARLRTIISGPQFLEYKADLVRTASPAEEN